MATEYYEIRVRGHLDAAWQDWFGGLVIQHESGGDSVLRGTVVDQAALHSILDRVRDLNLTLLSVQRWVPTPDRNEAKNGE